ncbi:MAG: MerR family transcriptional regulator [Rikenellaceae bacterium]
MESKKIYYTMGELVEMFDVSASLIRHWEGQFDIIRPVRNKKGNRLFTVADVENFKIIYHLVKERGMTLDGAKRALKKGSIVEGSAIERDALIMERLQHLRSMLVEMKSALDDSGEADVIDLDDGAASSLRGRNDSDREPDAESRELFAFYEQRLF